MPTTSQFSHKRTVDHVENDNQMFENYPIPATENRYRIQYTNTQLRHQLYRSILNDSVLKEIIRKSSHSLIHTYANDSIGIYCCINETNNNVNDHNAIKNHEDTIEFISQWLQLFEQNDPVKLVDKNEKQIWLISHVYTSVEYNRNHLKSLYAACRTLDQLRTTNYKTHLRDELKNNNMNRIEFEEKIFCEMFSSLWKVLDELCNKHKSDQDLLAWIQIYTFISCHYPSEKVLHTTELLKIKREIGLMHLCYIISLNENISSLIELLHKIINNDLFNDGCLNGIKNIIDLICQHQQQSKTSTHDSSKLLFDIIQWLLSLLEIKTLSRAENVVIETETLLKFINQSTVQFSVKQYIFDQISILTVKKNFNTIAH
ncbi:unnamed protein product [Didymodactylos carnosus]|uniref:Uncharacterized protein n=1 Tax=Didymodactylos carnosus TaxID=1234261 RepID=A0A814AWM1_9BILA|nr:unnamed protein product [Didymodactylos carnosus]CAF3699992.1 unnamed protein product [Didymodactylos carnosus]